MKDFQERLSKIDKRDRRNAVIRNYVVLVAIGIVVFIFG